MTSAVPITSAANWTDIDFGYDVDFDFFVERKHIDRGDGVTLYSVPTINSGAFYSVHFCVNACEIWLVDLRQLAKQIEFDRRFITYVPRKRKDGLPTARGYCLPCTNIPGQKWDMPPKLCDRLALAKTKDEIGRLTERAFEWLVNEREFFPTILIGAATRSSFNDDYRGGVDFWINQQIPVQVKLDGPGGTRGTGNLFFQTHTLPVSQCKDWHEFDRR